MTQLGDLRNKINVLDDQIVRLLDERMQTSLAIGEVKRAEGRQVFDREREYAVLERVLKAVRKKTVPPAALLDIYSDLMLASRRLQGEARPTGAPKLYAVLGHPVGHSLSPAMHNKTFQFMTYNGMYFAVDTINVNQTIRALKALDFGGASITMPHKESVVESLDELHGTARELKTVNTVVNDNGRLLGYNTDSEGAMIALKAETAIAGKKTLLVGAGGAARAVAYGLKAENADLAIVNRDVKKAEQLAELTGGRAITFDNMLLEAWDIVINATSVGMLPNVDAMPVPAELFRPGMVAMDIVYNPLKTMFLQMAAAKGCVTVDGLSMFVAQGARQFELWTSMTAPTPYMRQVVLSLL